MNYGEDFVFVKRKREQRTKPAGRRGQKDAILQSLLIIAVSLQLLKKEQFIQSFQTFNGRL